MATASEVWLIAAILVSCWLLYDLLMWMKKRGGVGYFNFEN